MARLLSLAVGCGPRYRTWAGIAALSMALSPHAALRSADAAETSASSVSQIQSAAQAIQSLLSAKKDATPIETARANAKKVGEFAGQLRATSLALDLSAGFDKGRTNDATNIVTNITVTRGYYPTELRIKSGMNLRTSSSSAGEDVSSGLVNIDHHPVRCVETYGFFERLRDDFLGVQRRDEVGFGVKFEIETHRWLTRKGGDLVAAARAFGKDRKWAPTPPPGADVGAAERLAASSPEDQKIGAAATTIADKDEFWDAIRKRYSVISVGFAVTLLGEVEQGRIKTDLIDSTGKATNRTFLLSDRQRFRVSLRPSLTFQPWDVVRIDGKFYCKLPLGFPARDFGIYDRRIDVETSMTINLTDEDGSGNAAQVVIDSRYSKDGSPPRLTESTLAELSTLRLTPRDIVAGKDHLAIAARLKIQLK